MYNEEIKIRFVKDYTQSLHTAQVAYTIFNVFTPYEEEWGADLCTRSTEELQPAIDEILGLRLKSQWPALTILKEYVRWCITMKMPGACDGMLHIKVAGLDKVRKQMVSSPFHLQQYLDCVFEQESEETIDNLHRCCLWMAFAGFRIDDVVQVKSADVDFANMVIHYKETDYPLYRESLPAFHNAAELESFLYYHPNYTKPIRRDRVESDMLMRGIKADTKIMTARATLSRRAGAAVKEGKTEQQLSFYRVWMSGLFFRMYERERAGVPVDFSEAAVEYLSSKGVYAAAPNSVDEKRLARKQYLVAREYMDDYQRWKLAFMK